MTIKWRDNQQQRATPKKLIPVAKISPFGAKARIIKGLQSKQALAVQAAVDPFSPFSSTIYPSKASIRLSPNAYNAIFVGYVRNTACNLLIRNDGKSILVLWGHHTNVYGVSQLNNG